MMKLTNKLRLTLLVPVIAGAIVVAPATVLAQHGTDDSAAQSNRKNLQPDDRTQSKASTETETNDNPAIHEAGDDNGNDSLKNRSAQLLSEKRHNGKQHTADQKRKSCESRAAGINKRADNYAAHAQKHLDVFNKTFTRVQAFQAKKQLTVTNYDALVAAATVKQAAAQTAVDELKALDVSIDCTQTDPASTVATLKTATANARTALHEYRKAIKDLVVALKGASTAEKTQDGSSPTTGSDGTGSNQ